ncbi:helix-turn-helix domain-containing protein, partial [Streptomyces sp. NPDC059837]|uniref:helix-turn-helix domain-containing protein n=1 Tax=Streptomyces sp. NPDC059837 TaxID=3346968 RepID=UPI003669C92A
MPKNLTVELASGQRFEVRRRLAGRDLSRNEPRRLERIRLLSRGMTAPQVAGLVECDPVTVRGAVRRFTCGGFDALADAPRPGRPGSAWCWEQPPAVAEIGALIGRAGVAVTVRVVPYGQARAPRTGTGRGGGAPGAPSFNPGDAHQSREGGGGET